MWAQKAKSNWILNGDRSTRYFQTVVRQRRARSRISHIKDEEGLLLEDPMEIENRLANHFMSSYEDIALLSVDSILSELQTIDIPKLSHQQCLEMNRLVTNLEIEDTIFQLGNYVNYNEVYHDRDIFVEDYKEMNRSFKIYVYPHRRNDPFANVLLPVGSEPGGNYASESYFKKVLMSSHFLTKDPTKADLFFLPFSIASLRHDPRIGVGGIKDFIKDYILNISQKYPYWNRTGGADHFYVACHSIGRRNDPFANVLLPVGSEPGGNYASESYFKKVLMSSHFLTKDPTKADLFFLPFSIASLRHDPRIGVGGIKDFIKDYILNISQKYPYWNRTGGADHFYVACHSIGRSAMDKANEVKVNAIQVVCSSTYFHPGYIAHKDACLPQIWPRQGVLPNLSSSNR
nr:putative glycosyltransferase [Quercus suber]